MRRGSQIVLHGVEIVEHRLDRRLVEPGQNFAQHAVAELLQPLDHRPGGGQQMQPLGAPVRRIVAPLDQAVVAQPVDQTRQRDRRDVEHLGEFRLLEPLVALEAHQHGPLRPRHIEGLDALVRQRPEQAGDVMQREGEFASEG